MEKMQSIKTSSVDLVLVDPPYGIMKKAGCSNAKIFNNGEDHNWDERLDTQSMMHKCARVIRQGGTAIIFGQNKYTFELMSNQITDLPLIYRAIWIKEHFANGLSCKKAMVSYFEDILIFRKIFDTLDDENKNELRKYSLKTIQFIGKPTERIIKEMEHRGANSFLRPKSKQFKLCTQKTYKELIEMFKINQMDGFMSYDDLKFINNNYLPTFNLPKGKKFKGNVLEYAKDRPSVHPTQKPVKLLEDLIYTYSNKGDTILDFCMGSGSTGVAANNLGRNFIGIELDKKYFNTAKRRIKNEI